MLAVSGADGPSGILRSVDGRASSHPFPLARCGAPLLGGFGAGRGGHNPLLTCCKPRSGKHAQWTGTRTRNLYYRDRVLLPALLLASQAAMLARRAARRCLARGSDKRSCSYSRPASHAARVAALAHALVKANRSTSVRTTPWPAPAHRCWPGKSSPKSPRSRGQCIHNRAPTAPLSEWPSAASGPPTQCFAARDLRSFWSHGRRKCCPLFATRRCGLVPALVGHTSGGRAACRRQQRAGVCRCRS